MAYESAKDGSNTTVIFEKTSNATDVEMGKVNANDAISKLVWHNAVNTGLGQDMTVTYLVDGKESPLEDAVYDSATDTLTWMHHETEGLYIGDYTILTLTKKTG